MASSVLVSVTFNVIQQFQFGHKESTAQLARVTLVLLTHVEVQVVLESVTAVTEIAEVTLFRSVFL